MSEVKTRDIPVDAPRSPMLEMFIIAAPIVASMASYTVMHMADTLMVSRLGATEIAAQGNGGIIAYVPLSIVMGLLGVINTYVAQHLGADRLREAPKYGWAGLWLSLGAWLLLLPLVPFLGPLYGLMGHAPELRQMETQYGTVMLLGAFFAMGARGIGHFFYGAHRPKVVLLATVTGNAVNIGVNFLLIFGLFGFPRLGVLGAAIGTVVGTMIEFAIPMIVFLGPKMNAELRTRAAWRFDRKAIREVFNLGWPAGLQFGNEILCWSIFMAWLVGIFGEIHNAAGWVALRYMHLSFMPAVGISFALTALVGKYLGAGDAKTAEARAWLGMWLTIAYMGLCAVGFVVFREQLISLFIAATDRVAPEDAAEMLRIGGQLMICAAVFQVFDAIGISISGALRGAGDTIWPGLVTAACSWILIIGGGVFMAFVFPQLESLGPWIGAAAYIIVLSLLLLWRFRAGPWRTMKLLEDERTPAPVDLASASEEVAAKGVALKD
jgi:MATE family, multidrug efflux pump